MTTERDHVWNIYKPAVLVSFDDYEITLRIIWTKLLHIRRKFNACTICRYFCYFADHMLAQ